MNKFLQAELTLSLSPSFSDCPFMQSVNKEFGPKGYALVTSVLLVLCEKGGAVRYSRPLVEAILATIPDVSAGLVDMVVRKMVRDSFLDSRSFRHGRMLSPSVAAQSYYSFRHNVISSEENTISSEENGKTSEENTLNAEETPSKSFFF